MKVVFIITSLASGGAQSMLVKLLERLDSRFSPHVIVLKGLGDVSGRIKSLGVPVEALDISRGIAAPFAVLRLARRLRILKPQIVHTWLYHADLIGGAAAMLAGVPSVAWTIRHGNLQSDKNKRSTLAVAWLCARLSSRIPTAIVSCSENASRVHIDHGYARDKIVMVPNGFDLTAFRPNPAARDSVRTELKLESQTPLVGWIGRFHPQKNPEGFFEAAAKLHRRLPQVHFLIAGEGMDSSNMSVTRMVEASQLAPVTHLLGVRKDIPRLMAAMDVLASSSSGEAFSNVLGEAMSSGIPCAVTDVGDSANIVGESGRVVAAGDMAGLAAQLEELLTLPECERLALGSRARKRVTECFEIQNVVQQYESFYDRLAPCDRR